MLIVEYGTQLKNIVNNYSILLKIYNTTEQILILNLMFCMLVNTHFYKWPLQIFENYL